MYILILNTIIHCLFLFLGLTLFFKYFVINLSTELFKDQIENIIDEILENIEENDIINLININKDYYVSQIDYILSGRIGIDNISSELKQQFKYMLGLIKNRYQLPNEVVKVQNKYVMSMAISIIVFMTICLFSSIITAKILCKTKIPLIQLFIVNLLIIGIIGIIEYIFFMNVTINYVPILPSEISTTFIEKFREVLLK